MIVLELAPYPRSGRLALRDRLVCTLPHLSESLVGEAITTLRMRSRSHGKSSTHQCCATQKSW